MKFLGVALFIIGVISKLPIVVITGILVYFSAKFYNNLERIHNDT